MISTVTKAIVAIGINIVTTTIRNKIMIMAMVGGALLSEMKGHQTHLIGKEVADCERGCGGEKGGRCRVRVYVYRSGEYWRLEIKDDQRKEKKRGGRSRKESAVVKSGN